MAGRPDLTTFTAPFTVVSFIFLTRRFVPAAVRCRPSLAMYPSFIDPSPSLKDGSFNRFKDHNIRAEVQSTGTYQSMRAWGDCHF